MVTFWDFFEGTLSRTLVELDSPPGYASRHPTLGLS